MKICTRKLFVILDEHQGLLWPANYHQDNDIAQFSTNNNFMVVNFTLRNFWKFTTSKLLIINVFQIKLFNLISWKIVASRRKFWEAFRQIRQNKLIVGEVKIFILNFTNFKNFSSFARENVSAHTTKKRVIPPL